MGPYDIFKRIQKVAYELKLPNLLGSVHQIIHVSMLKKCICDSVSFIPLIGLWVNENRSYEEVPITILYRQVKKWRNYEVVFIKVLWTIILIRVQHGR